jgi:hypothetical protein
MAFGRQMNDIVDGVFLEYSEDFFGFSQVSFHETVIGPAFDILEIGQVASVGEGIQVDKPMMGMAFYQPTYDMRADKTSASCDQDGAAFVVC